MNPADTARLASNGAPPAMHGAAGIVQSHSREEGPTMLGRLGNWWRNWREHTTTLAGLREIGDAELARMATDLGMGAGDLEVLAGKWPDAADLVTRRATALGLDADAIRRTEPEVMRDLQRVCSLCADKRACEHDLSRAPEASHWQDYCPNAQTLDATRKIRSREID